MHQVDCPVCGSRRWQPLFSTRDSLLTEDTRQYSYVRCCECGVSYLNPQPDEDDLAGLYSAEYLNQIGVPSRPGPIKRRLIEYGISRRVHVIEKEKAGGTILEVGCGDGTLLNALTETGRWSAQGIDISKEAVDIAKGRHGVEARVARAEDLGDCDDRFDAVVMWDVLEHAAMPGEMLRSIRHVLNPGGVLIMRIPLLDAWDARLFGEHWAGWDAPRHLTVFSSSTLQKLLEDEGFTMKPVRSLGGSYSMLAISARFAAAGTGVSTATRLAARALSRPSVQMLVAPLVYGIACFAPTSQRIIAAYPAP